MRRLALLLCLAVALVVGLYYAFSPYQQQKREVKRMLKELSKAASSGDPVQALDALAQHLAPDATVSLNVTYATFERAPPPMLQQTFNREEFLRFIDLTLYTLERWSYRARLAEFTLPGPIGKAKAITQGEGEAEGMNQHRSRGIPMLYLPTDACTLEIDFPSNSPPVIAQAECEITLRMRSKNNADVLKLVDNQF